MAEKKIGDKTYRVMPMLATEAIVLQARLVRVLAGTLDRLPDIFAGASPNATEEMRNRSNQAAISAFAEVFRAADPQEMAALVKDVAETAQIMAPSGEWRGVDFDGDFTGKLGDMLPVIVFVLREQFGDFFTAARASGGRKVPTARA